VIQNTDRN